MSFLSCVEIDICWCKSDVWRALPLESVSAKHSCLLELRGDMTYLSCVSSAASCLLVSIYSVIHLVPFLLSLSVMLEDLTVNITYDLHALEIAVLLFYAIWDQPKLKTVVVFTFSLPQARSSINSLRGWHHFHGLLGSDMCSAVGLVMGL